MPSSWWVLGISQQPLRRALTVRGASSNQRTRPTLGVRLTTAWLRGDCRGRRPDAARRGHRRVGQERHASLHGDRGRVDDRRGCAPVGVGLWPSPDTHLRLARVLEAGQLQSVAAPRRSGRGGGSAQSWAARRAVPWPGARLVLPEEIILMTEAEYTAARAAVLASGEPTTDLLDECRRSVELLI